MAIRFDQTLFQLTDSLWASHERADLLAWARHLNKPLAQKVNEMIKRTYEKGIRLLMVLGVMMVMLGPPSALPMFPSQCPPPGTGNMC